MKMSLYPEIWKQIASKSISYVILRIFFGFISFGVMVLLTRTLGAAEYGIYVYAISLVSILVMFSQLGLPTLILRETAKAVKQDEWELVNGLWDWALRISFSLALLFCVIGILYLLYVGPIFGVEENQKFKFPWVALVLVPLTVSLNNKIAIMRGFDAVVLAPLLQKTFSQLFIFLFLISSVYLLSVEKINSSQIIVIEIIGLLIAMLISYRYLLVQYKQKLQFEAFEKKYSKKYWITAAMPLGVIVGLRSINANLDIIVLGWFEASGEIAKYKIAVRFSSVALLGQEIVIMVFSGYFARLFKNNETKLLSDLTKKGALLSTCIAVGVLLLCLFWGDILISLFFGAEFMGSFAPLMIIVFGYTICMPMGMVSTLLNMTGHEKRTALGAAIATI